jgi:hypothetical protein
MTTPTTATPDGAALYHCDACKHADNSLTFEFRHDLDPITVIVLCRDWRACIAGWDAPGKDTD